MTSIPRLTLSTGAPRRIFVPFTQSMDIAADTLWDVVKKDRKSGDVRGVVFFFQTPKAGAKGANEFGVHSARLQPNGRADFSLWQDGISGWRTLEDGTVTIRDRDTTKQERLPVDKLISYFQNGLR